MTNGCGAEPARRTTVPPHDLVTLLELSRELSVHPDLDTLLRRIETVALHVLDCERLTVFVNEPLANALRSRLATGAHEIRTPTDRGIAGATFKESRVINVEDAAADHRFYDAIDRQTGFRTRSLLCVPLRGIDNDTIGVLELLNKRVGAFTAADEELAVTLGALTGIALERQALVDHYREKRRLEHDLRLARDIQRSLLPVAFPAIPGFDIVAWTQPADATGGDFYDCFDLPDGRHGLVVADVTGHGLAASLLACETRAVIRTVAASTSSIVEIATRTNALLHRDLHHERFVVLFLAALEATTSHLEFVGAGCAPIVYRQTENRFVPLEATVPPLGVLPVVEGTIAMDLTLRAGDTLAMLTDGLYEWENDGGLQFGLERLGESVRHHASRPAAHLIRSVYEDVLAHAKRVPQIDDLTAMVIKRVT
jgi:serine phosphatase RsbU (regulator of sigma subunit)